MWIQGIYTNDSTEIILSLYLIFGLYHVLNNGKTYRQPHKALPWHIFSGAIEVLLYYSGFKCSLLAIAACLVHSGTSLMLVNGLPNGYPPHTRPTYQAGSFMRPIQMLWAFYSQKSLDYHDAIMPIHGFVYTRAFFFILGTMGPTTSFLKNVNSRYVYTQAILGGALMAVGHCSRPTAVGEYLVLVHVLGKVSFWTKQHYEYSRKQGSTPSLLARFLFSIGLVTRGEALLESSVANPKIVPEIGNLPVDKLGHQWAEFN